MSLFTTVAARSGLPSIIFDHDVDLAAVDPARLIDLLSGQQHAVFSRLAKVESGSGKIAEISDLDCAPIVGYHVVAVGCYKK